MQQFCLILTRKLMPAFLSLLLAACGGGEQANSRSVTPGAASCGDTAAYVPAMNPVVIPAASGNAKTSVIVIHDKLSTPLGTGLQVLLSELAAANLHVVAPYLPWSTTTWTGSLCEGMAYVDQLVTAEAEKGRNIVIAGHNMGGSIALYYGATKGVSNPLKAVKAIISIVPGHMLHLDDALQQDIVDSMALARQMMDNGMGNIPALFDTRSNGESVQVAATPSVYLSYHALDQFPDIRQVAPLQNLPILWLAGNKDPRTSTYNYATLASKITVLKSQYQILSGDHETILSNAGGPIAAWLNSLGL